MKLQSKNPFHRSRSQLAAFTLVEVLIAAGLGTFVLAIVASLTVFTARSFVGMGNYNDLERASSHTLDLMSKEVRQAATLSPGCTDQCLKLSLQDGSPLAYVYNPEARTLTQLKGGQRTVLLEGCDFLRFNYSQRNPGADFTFYSVTNYASRPDLVKLIDVSWRCSRKILGQKVNTESVQTARIVIRN